MHQLVVEQLVKAFSAVFFLAIIDVGARLKFDSAIFTTGFPKGCDCGKCSSLCCEAGVLIDEEERDKIVSIKEELLPLLMPDRKNPEKWFSAPDDEDLTRGSEKPLKEEDKEGIFVTGNGADYCNSITRLSVVHCGN